MDITFHYPPELLSILVDTIPLLCRSKQDTLLFLKGAGVSDTLTNDLWQIVRTKREQITKYEIVRSVLTRLNERGEPALRERREIIKRVVQFDDFSACWEADRLKAQGLVSQIQKLVDVKDSFTRMKDEREKERRENIAKREAKLQQIQKQRDTIDGLKTELFALFGELDPKRRGKLLEDILNRLFHASGIAVRQAFTLNGSDGEGIVEQIDGVIELDGQLYFVEMKWWQNPVGVPEIAQHMMRVFLRAEARALIISASEYTAPAVAECRQALSQKVVTLCTLQEVVMVLEKQSSLAGFLRRKVHSTIMDKSPFPQVSFD
jgi:restriction system protein